MKIIIICLIFLVTIGCSSTHEFYVSVNGSDSNNGSKDKPFKTIQSAANTAQQGDVIVVHAGVYRERVTPPRGGISDTKRITYQAAEREKVEIKGSEEIKKWIKVDSSVWKVTLLNSFFGKYNPYQDTIWGDWFVARGRKHHTGDVYLNNKSLYEMDSLNKVMHPVPYISRRDPQGSTLFWYCESNEKETTIYANFNGADPNKELVEINVRDACFYPDKPFVNYITVRGFYMSQAATQWAPPTAEQIGLIGTHWSKGWIIENNTISNSRCTGITLGKDRKSGQNVWTKDPSKDGAIHYVDVIKAALKNGWNKDSVGSHIVRNNVIFDCGQAGICGSLGAVFSEISNNHIYNIWTKRQFDGPEKAGIKIHAAIDVVIRNNRIHNAYEGIWLDWMAQGIRITANLCYNNDKEDFFSEVDHGPYLVDNNLFLSDVSLWDWSDGGAFVHNLIAGRVNRHPETRETPYHKAHSTEMIGLRNLLGGDTRFINNIFTGSPVEDNNGQYQKWWGKFDFGLNSYNDVVLPVMIDGNVYLHGAKKYFKESNCIEDTLFDPRIKIIDEGKNIYLQMNWPAEVQNLNASIVTTALLGKTAVAQLPFENADGTALTIDCDYNGKKRNEKKPTPGPFENSNVGQIKMKVW